MWTCYGLLDPQCGSENARSGVPENDHAGCEMIMHGLADLCCFRFEDTSPRGICNHVLGLKAKNTSKLTCTTRGMCIPVYIIYIHIKENIYIDIDIHIYIERERDKHIEYYIYIFSIN